MDRIDRVYFCVQIMDTIRSILPFCRFCILKIVNRLSVGIIRHFWFLHLKSNLIFNFFVFNFPLLANACSPLQFHILFFFLFFYVAWWSRKQNKWQRMLQLLTSYSSIAAYAFVLVIQSALLLLLSMLVMLILLCNVYQDNNASSWDKVAPI